MNIRQKPTLVNVIAWTTLASGIVNIGWSIVAFTTFIGVICAPLSVLPLILGLFEIIYAAKLLGNPAQPLKPSTNIAIFEIAAILYGNVFATAVGVLSLVFYNDTVVKDYFARLNETPVPVAPAPITDPASLPSPKPAPVMEEPILSGDEGVAPEPGSPSTPPEETPSKPKRTPRKMAGQ